MRRLLCFLVIMCFLLSVSACKTATGYPQFRFGDFESNDDANYLSESSYENIRCFDCAFIPNMRAINHQEYAVDFYVYSANADPIVSLDKIEIVHKDNLLITTVLDCPVVWQKTETGIFCDTIRTITIPMESTSFNDGDQIQIKLYVSVSENGSKRDSILLFDGSVWQYTTVVFPV